MSTNERLKELMEQYQLTKSDVARLTGYSLSSVESWLVSSKAKKFRSIPPLVLPYLDANLLLHENKKEDHVSFQIEQHINSASYHAESALKDLNLMWQTKENVLTERENYILKLLERACYDVRMAEAIMSLAKIDSMDCPG